MALVIVSLDTLVALLAGLAIFPLVFANGLNPAAGPGLIFQTLPLAFGSMAGGTFIGSLFFILLFLAALTSAISLIEPTIAWLIESKGVRRIKASVWTGVVIWSIGLATIFSMQGVTIGDVFGRLLGGIELNSGLFKYDFFQVIDFITASIMLPVGGLLIALFAGWIMHQDSTEREFSFKNKYIYLAWQIMVRYVSPFLVLMVFLNIIGIYKF